MKFTKNNKGALSQLWRRNAVVGAITLFVCVAVYLNWNYEQDVGKTLGEATMVTGETDDPLLTTPIVTTESVTEEGAAVPSSDTDGATSVATTDDYFATARLNRQQARDSALTLLQNAAAEPDADQTLKDEANLAIQTMADYTVTEAQIENMVVAKGYTDCVAFIGSSSVSLAVSAPQGGITDADTARILDVVLQGTDFTADQIKIVEVT